MQKKKTRTLGKVKARRGGVSSQKPMKGGVSRSGGAGRKSKSKKKY